MTNQDGSSPLHVAALHGRVDLVPLLLKHGASVGARNAKQAVPLHLACQQGHFQVWVLSLGQSVRGLAFGRNRSCWECCTGARVGRLAQSTAPFLPPSPRILGAHGRTTQQQHTDLWCFWGGASPPPTAIHMWVMQAVTPILTPAGAVSGPGVLVSRALAMSSRLSIPTALCEPFTELGPSAGESDHCGMIDFFKVLFFFLKIVYLCMLFHFPSLVCKLSKVRNHASGPPSRS